MAIFEILRKDKVQRFALTMRQEGLGSALRKTRRYLGARLRGHGLTSLYRRKSGKAEPGAHLSRAWLELAEMEAFNVSHAPATLTKRRKIAMIGDLNLPQCRKYRVEQLHDIWRMKNVEYVYSHYEDVPRAVNIMQDATHVAFYRLASTPVTTMLAYEARRLRLPILYDLDDPLFSVSAYGTYQNMKALPDFWKTHFMNEAPRYLDVMNGSDIISVSTPGLVDHARLYTQRPVYLRRNFADASTLTAGTNAVESQARDSTAFRIGFASGSQGHEMDFAEIQDDIIAFLGGASDRRLVILGHFNKKLLPEKLRDQVEEHPFTNYDLYLETLVSVDVAVMPLHDDTFNRCKSGVRVIDAASVAVPSIVGTVSDMANMVDDTKTGRVLAPGANWASVLDDMERDRAGTRAMGQAARAALVENWTARLELPVIDPKIIDWVCS